jgi:hypothetical protein
LVIALCNDDYIADGVAVVKHTYEAAPRRSMSIVSIDGTVVAALKKMVSATLILIMNVYRK